jgi:hypothetical protein
LSADLSVDFTREARQPSLRLLLRFDAAHQAEQLRSKRAFK